MSDGVESLEKLPDANTSTNSSLLHMHMRTIEAPPRRVKKTVCIGIRYICVQKGSVYPPSCLHFILVVQTVAPNNALR